MAGYFIGDNKIDQEWTIIGQGAIDCRHHLVWLFYSDSRHAHPLREAVETNVGITQVEGRGEVALG